MDTDAWYFAYGSNLFVEQKERRTGRIRKAMRCRLKDYRLAFNKRGAKGNIYANIIPEPTEEVWGVIYLCSPSAFQEMDQCEGVSTGHYEHATVTVQTEGGESVTALTYVAGAAHVCDESSPNLDYLRKIIRGAKHHRLPARYIRSIEIRAKRGNFRDHERLWRGFWVDQGLKNRWLDQLNSLEAFQLISICEGHPTKGLPTRRSAPHINLRMKAEFVVDIANAWNQCAREIQTLLASQFFVDHTNVTVELRRQIHSLQNASGIDDDLVIHVNSQFPAGIDLRDDLVSDWFDRCVASIRQMDSEYARIVASLKTAQQAIQPDTGEG